MPADSRVPHPLPVPVLPVPVLPEPVHPGGPYRVCLVCLGNICRSPMAATVVAAELDRAGLAGRVVVDSAGTGNWHRGEPMDPRARAELSRRGYDGSAHRARQIDRSWLPRYDLILAMDDSNLRNLELMAAGQPGAAGRVALLRWFDPAADARAQVPDPYDGADSGFATVYEMVAAAARGLARQLASQLGKPGQPAGPQPAGG